MSAALVIEAAVQFGRSVALTRLLSTHEFGISAAMVTVLTVIDMGTFVAADRYLVHAQDGGTVSSLAVAHTLTLARNLLCALLLLLLAYPTARLLDVGSEAPSFCFLALIPVIRGFENLRLEQLQRGHRFLPWAAACSLTNIAGLAAAASSALVLHDHRAVLWGLSIQAVTLVFATHAFAGVPYRISIAQEPIADALRFGLPLMVNGLALAALGQLDRLAVGTFLGVSELGRYGLATMIFYVPTALSMRVMVSVLQPRLSAAWHQSPLWRFPYLFGQINIWVASVAAIVGAAVALMGSPLLALIFGPRYVVGDAFFCLFGLALFMRYAKTSLNFGGLAMGRTMALMWSNLSICVGLVVTFTGLCIMPALIVAAVGCVVGEFVGAAFAFLLLKRDLSLPGKALYWPFILGLPIPMAAGLWVELDHPALTLRVSILAVMTCSVLLSAGLKHFRSPMPVTD